MNFLAFLNIFKKTNSIREINSIDDLTFKEISEIKAVFDNKYYELNKFLSVIKAVRDSRLHEIDYTNEIEELMNGFNVGCELSNTNYQFDYSVNSYADKGKRWFGTFSDNWNKIRVSVIHIPTDKNIGQRIEINFNSREFNFSMFIAGRFFFKDYVVKRVHGYNYSIKFEDPKEIVRILNFLNSRLEDEA